MLRFSKSSPSAHLVLEKSLRLTQFAKMPSASRGAGPALRLVKVLTSPSTSGCRQCNEMARSPTIRRQADGKTRLRHRAQPEWPADTPEPWRLLPNSPIARSQSFAYGVRRCPVLLKPLKQAFCGLVWRATELAWSHRQVTRSAPPVEPYGSLSVAPGLHLDKTSVFPQGNVNAVMKEFVPHSCGCERCREFVEAIIILRHRYIRQQRSPYADDQ